MTLRIVHRPARVTRAVEATEREMIAPPPIMPDGPVGGLPMQTMLPVLGALSSMTMIMVLRTNPVMVVVGAMILVVALVGGVGMALSQRGNQAKTRRTQREHYLDYLETLRGTLRGRGRELRENALLLDPDPGTLGELVNDPARRWERRRSDVDFLRVRIGLGDVRCFDLAIPDDANPVQPYDPIMTGEAQAVVRHYSRVQAMPVTIDLAGASHVSIIGERGDVLGAARALLLQIAAMHSPDDVQLAAVFPEHAAADWAGVDLLPHLSMSDTFDGPVPARRLASSTAALAQVISGELGERAQRAATAKRKPPAGRARALPDSALVVFIDDFGQVASVLPSIDAELGDSELRIIAVHLLSDRLHEPSEVTVRLSIDAGTASIDDVRADAAAEPLSARIDRVELPLLAGIARTLSPLRVSLSAQEQLDEGRAIGVTELLGIRDLADFNTAASWAPRSPRDFLRVPIGVDDVGAPVLLDLKESAQLGMGPHGICIGATGSGKSEMLRTLILGLALSHSPDDLSMVLVDYKGGAAFAPFKGLPHVAGIIDNLADDPQLTERARSSIAGEVVRRQQLLKDAGSSASISHYRELRAERPELPPMPHLLVVIDEFGELLTAEPDFVDLLLTIGRIGRSIGVHLLLSSQRIEGGKLRGLDTYLSYRLGLRTFSEAESAVILDTPDAFHLPAVPGFGYLKVDTSIYRRFRAGYVSGPVPGDLARELAEPESAAVPLLLPVYNGVATDGDEAAAEEELSRPTTGRALIDECVDRLRTAARSTAPVWLPPLPNRVTLARALQGSVTEDGASTLQVPIGLLDDPTKQRQAPWRLDLTRSGGHVAVIGAPQSGRSTFLRTVAASIALTQTPRQVTVYGMDLTGGGLGRIEQFPHVGGVATRGNRDRLRRLLEELHGMLATREAVFRDHGIDSPAMLRTAHAAGRIPELVSADVVLLVDGLAQLRADFEDLEEPLADLLRRGGSFGIHVVITMNRWNDMRMNLQSLVGTRLELRINDPADSVISRKLSTTLKANQPGRILTDASLLAQTALPTMEDVDDALLGDALEALAAQTAAGWQGPAAAPIRLLPEDLSPALLPDVFDEPDRLPFGLRQDTMEPVFLELGTRDQHLLVFGDTQAGKSTVLRSLLTALVDRYTADELVVALMDLRGDLVGGVPDDYMGGHASNSREARGLAVAIAEELEKRQDAGKAAGATNASPRIVVVVDDYDILASGGMEPLKPLLPYLASARDLRLHVLLARPVSGSSRAMFDVALQTIRDTGGSAIVMSGERSEGQILPQLYAEQMVPGRGRFVRRGERPRLIQVANVPLGATAQGVAQSNADGNADEIDDQRKEPANAS
ncbi:MAG: type VII secretion protein EccCa [Microterricola sp.]